MGSGGGIWETDDLIDAARMNQKTLYVGSSAPSPTYVGQLWFDSDDNTFYQRNKDDDGWLEIGGGNPFNQDLNTTDSPTFVELTLSGDGATYGINIGTDGQIYRYTTNYLRTPDTFQTDTELFVGATYGLDLQPDKIYFGDEASAWDFYFGRDSANVAELIGATSMYFEKCAIYVNQNPSDSTAGHIYLYGRSPSTTYTADMYVFTDGNWVFDAPMHILMDLPDAAGTYRFAVRDSAFGEVFSADSDGNVIADGYIRGTQLWITGDRLEETETDSDSISVAINYRGYNNGTTRFRDFKVFDGKQAQKIFMDGSADSLAISTASTTITLLNQYSQRLVLPYRTSDGTLTNGEIWIRSDL